MAPREYKPRARQSLPRMTMAKSGLFYLIVNPGLESVAKLELFEAWLQAPAFFSLPSLPEISLHKGGLEFEAPLEFGCYLNKILRIPNRILLRLKTFEATHESDLQKGLESIDWNQWMPKGRAYQLQFTTKSSRLSYKKQIEQIAKKVLKEQKQTKDSGPLLQIRIFRDQCTVSLDTTGARAQFRGEGKKVSRAPLRDNLAAGLVRTLLQGLDGDIELIDPLCGSGTFLIEALEYGHPILRGFAFENFPIFQNVELPEPEVSLKKKIHVLGMDRDREALNIANENMQRFPKEIYQIQHQDLFAENEYPPVAAGVTRVVLANPPWGRRLKTERKDYLSAINKKFKPQRLGLLVPLKWAHQNIEMEKVKDVLVSNSGLENRFLLFAR